MNPINPIPPYAGSNPVSAFPEQKKRFTTDLFFMVLHEMNIKHGANVRGRIHYEYNHLCKQQGLNEEIPGGEDHECLGMDQKTTIGHPDIYYQAYQKVLSDYNDHSEIIESALKEVAIPQIKAESNAPVPSISVKELQRFDKYNAFLLENELDGDRDLLIPNRRVCEFGPKCSNEELVKNAVFITEAQIIKIYPMRFLRKSPFIMPMTQRSQKVYESWDDPNHPGWIELFDRLPKQMHGVGRTECGKHVILQQAVKSCVPSCVAMLVLDRGKTPDYKAIQTTHGANADRAVNWIKTAGLLPQLTIIQQKENAEQAISTFLKDNNEWIESEKVNPQIKIVENEEDVVTILRNSIENYGSGVLAIDHPQLGGHVIVLDEISQELNTALIRDSFHGWALTIRLDSLISWVDKGSGYFLQIDSDC